jgi:hypothetical protein
MTFLLGQRYVPDANQVLALAEADRIRHQSTSTVRLVSTTFVPNEEWVFDLLEADSSEAVDRAYRAGDVAYERITQAVHVT